jgi:two-component system nitrogen regulation sensor histidine kinase NtrY
MSDALDTLGPPSIEDGQARGRRFEFSRLVRAAGYVTVVLALTAAAVTFFVLMGLTPVAPNQSVVRVAMLANGGLVLLLALIVGWEIGRLVLARQRRRAAARLHIRIVTLFSAVAATPAILVAIVASVTLDRGLDNWFSTRTRAIIDNSVSIAQAYVEQQGQIVRTDLAGLKYEIERGRSLLIEDPDKFQDFLNNLARSQGVSGVSLVTADGEEVARARSGSFDVDDVPPPPKEALQEVQTTNGEPVLIAPGNGNYMGAIVRLTGYNDLYLYLARSVDPQVVRYVTMTTQQIGEYKTLEATRFGIQIAFGILYLGIAMVVLLSAIWVGIAFANQLVAPIRRLIDAAEKVSHGTLDIQVPVRRSEGDLAALGETFNTMTSKLRTQREELLSANEQIDSRRRFTEAVLSGVTAGVIGIDGEGRITIANRTALNLFGAKSETAVDRPIAEIIPAIGPVVEASLRSDRREHRDQVTIVRAGRERTLNVRVTTEQPSSGHRGYVITIDDITDLITAQRSSAWADVARRIAHEIKNPLTPIQLSAERLRRKFGKTIVDDRAVFDQCTDTIIRQVGDIGRMVDEFSSFARMPKPTFEVRNLSESIREAVFLLEVSHPDITFATNLPDEPLVGRFDTRQMAQALTNLVKNATEAIAAVPAERASRGSITVNGTLTDSSIVVDVIDNGIGLPSENRHRLVEPYMTTREKGTGLGLAIVTKIVEDHGGRIELLDSPEVATGGHGAMIRIVLPRADLQQSTEAEPAAANAAAAAQ